jgi:phosphoribosylformylglycinamidine cyclo-ligase
VTGGPGPDSTADRDRGAAEPGPATYASAGVDIAAGDRAVERIKSLVASTARPEVLGSIGGFGGCFAFDPSRYRQPVLVSSTDGVGTKVLVARDAGRFDTVGIDLVAMCVDDLVCVGAEPLFLLDYVVTGKLVPDQMEALVAGVADGCRQAGCALLGGEMAEHPGAMGPGEFDLAGFAVGAVDRDAMLGVDRVEVGDVLVGLASPGLRSNGYTLARHVLVERAGRSLDDPAWSGAEHSLADELLRPSVVYAPAVLAAVATGGVHAAAHITGGGITGNLPRVLPATVDAVVERSRWSTPRIFEEIQALGDVDDAEMARVFNLGLGMILVVDPGGVENVLAALAGTGQEGSVVGRLLDGTGEVQMVPG